MIWTRVKKTLFKKLSKNQKQRNLMKFQQENQVFKTMTKMFLKINTERKCIKTANDVFKMLNEGRFSSPDSKTYHKATITKTATDQ